MQDFSLDKLNFALFNKSPLLAASQRSYWSLTGWIDAEKLDEI